MLAYTADLSGFSIIQSLFDFRWGAMQPVRSFSVHFYHHRNVRFGWVGSFHSHTGVRWKNPENHSSFDPLKLIFRGIFLWQILHIILLTVPLYAGCLLLAPWPVGGPCCSARTLTTVSTNQLTGRWLRPLCSPWVFSGYSGFPTQSKIMHISLKWRPSVACRCERVSEWHACLPLGLRTRWPWLGIIRG